MKKSKLESLLKKAKELEKKYEWLQAAENYNKASDLALEEKEVLKAVEFQEKLGFCFYRAALQAKSNPEFRKIMKYSMLAYEKESKLLEEENREKYKIKIKSANALVLYANSWYETDPKKKKEILDNWWTLESQLLKYYENIGDLHSIGRTYNDMNEYSSYFRFWLVSNYSELSKMFKEGINFAERAIKIFSKLDDKYQLARAYWIASWYYGFSDAFVENENKLIQFIQKCQNYANNALKLSKEIGDAWLISRSYNAAYNAAQSLNFEPTTAIEIGKNMLKYGTIAKDTFVIGFGNCLTSLSIAVLARYMEDPDKQKERFQKAANMAQKATHNFQIINQIVGFSISYPIHSLILGGLARIETDSKKRQGLLNKALKLSQEALEYLTDWKRIILTAYHSLSMNFYLISKTRIEVEEKRELLNEAKIYRLKALNYRKKFMPFSFAGFSSGYYQFALVQNELANVETKKQKKIELLDQAAISMEKSVQLVQKKQKLLQSAYASGYYFGIYYDKLGGIRQKTYALTKEKNRITKAISAYKNAIFYFRKAKMPTHLAESYWHLAQIYDQLSNLQEASKNYELSSESYKNAEKKIPQLKQFYKDFSLYMSAWSQIEQARYAHSIEDYDNAKKHYEKAAKLHELSEPWKYIASNYSAWARIEEAENSSRNEQTERAKQTFQKALELFNQAEKSIKHRTSEIASAEEKELNQRLLQALDHRRRFCYSRIQIEEAKLLDKKGNYLDSSKSYKEAAQNIQSIVEKVESKAERKEMKYLATLCQAWEKMASAEETTSSGLYLEAAKLFEKAKEYCYTKKASLWTLGSSSFCKGLAAKNQFQSTFEKSYHSMANKQVEQAADYYGRAGFQAASEYAKATQRLLDAYVYIHSAQEEVDPEKKTRFYQLSEHLLQIAAGLFMKAEQPEKKSEIQRILVSVREEKALAASLNEVMHAPTITSSTLSFTAPSPTSEVSVGLEQFQHANVQANLIAGIKEVKVGESFCLTVEFVNAGKEPALLTRVEDFVPSDFIVVKKPEIYRLEESCLNLKGKQIAPLKLVEAKVVLQPSKKGVYTLSPTVHYLDELGQNKALQLKAIEIKVEEVVLSDRVSTGTKELDSLLLGGIPKEYAVVLTGSPSDERELIIKNFLEAGTNEEQTSFYVATEAAGINDFLEKPGFYLFLCNPKPKVGVPDLPNVTRLRSKTDLTNLNIALLKAYRNVEQPSNKRVCINIISDVLVDHGAKTTRKWIAELTTDLVSKGFTVLAVINPEMHTPEQIGAVLDLFDGEVSITQTGDPQECKKSLRVKKLRNQDYIKNPICLANPIKS